MHIAESYRGHTIEATSVREQGKWGFNYSVHGFPKPGRTFSARATTRLFDSEKEALGAAVDAGRDEIETFVRLAEIEAATQ